MSGIMRIPEVGSFYFYISGTAYSNGLFSSTSTPTIAEIIADIGNFYNGSKHITESEFDVDTLVYEETKNGHTAGDKVLRTDTVYNNVRFKRNRITYKTVIANAIEGFNNIQDKIHTNSGQLKATANGYSTIDAMLSSLDSATISVSKGSATVGTLTGVAPTSSESYTLSTDKYSIVNSQDTSDAMYYYIKLSATGGSQPITVSASKAGLVKKATLSTQTISTSGAGTKYIKIPKAKISVTARKPQITNTNVTISETNSASGISLKASSWGTLSVQSRGWLPNGTSSDTMNTTVYLTALTVPENKTLSSITNNGTITSISNTGTVNIPTNTGVVKYVDWKIHQNSTTSALEFRFTPTTSGSSSGGDASITT